MNMKLAVEAWSSICVARWASILPMWTILWMRETQICVSRWVWSPQWEHDVLSVWQELEWVPILRCEMCMNLSVELDIRILEGETEIMVCIGNKEVWLIRNPSRLKSKWQYDVLSLAISFQVSAISYQLSGISFELSDRSTHIHYSLFTTHHSLFTTHHSPLTNSLHP